MSREDFPMDLLPKIAREYTALCSECTESPPEFHVAGFLFVTSTLLSKWYVGENLFLNNYYLLVGDTGTSRKTTAQNYARRLLEEVTNAATFAKAEIPINGGDSETKMSSAYSLVTHFSIEGLQSHGLGNGVSAGLLIGEYGSIFDVSKRQGQQNTITELTSMYDLGPISVRTVSRCVDVEGYALGDFHSARNVGGGFTNRHLIFSGTPSTSLPFTPCMNENRFKGIAAELVKLIPTSLKLSNTRLGTTWNAPQSMIVWTQEARLLWKNFYNERILQLRQLSGSPICDIAARETTHACKLACIRAILEGRMELQVEDIQFGVRLARWCCRNLADLLKCGNEKRWDDSATRKVIHAIEKHGPMSKQTMARKFGGKQDDYNRAIGHLQLDGVLEQLSDGTLVLSGSTPNQQTDEINFLLGKTNISEFCDAAELEVGPNLPDSCHV
jgi:hypothetical protein